MPLPLLLNLGADACPKPAARVAATAAVARAAATAATARTPATAATARPC